MTIDLLCPTEFYCGVNSINKIYFNYSSDKFVDIDFSYKGGNATIEVYVEKGVSDKDKPSFLVQVYLVVDSLFNNAHKYMTYEDLVTAINSLNI